MKDEWVGHLTAEQRRVVQDKGTEAPFSGSFLHNEDEGIYTCVACDNILFASDTKFDSGSGWPSFYEVAKSGSVKLVADKSLGVMRTEVVCARCGGHLGHVFDDAPEQPSGKRYCINSLSLAFKPKENK